MLRLVATVPLLIMLQAALVSSNFTTSNRTLLLDGAPHLLRGVAYSPTPIGTAPTATRSLDFFTAEHAPIYERDLPRIAAIGANSVRIYAFDAGSDH